MTLSVFYIIGELAGYFSSETIQNGLKSCLNEGFTTTTGSFESLLDDFNEAIIASLSSDQNSEEICSFLPDLVLGFESTALRPLSSIQESLLRLCYSSETIIQDELIGIRDSSASILFGRTYWMLYRFLVFAFLGVSIHLIFHWAFLRKPQRNPWIYKKKQKESETPELASSFKGFSSFVAVSFWVFFSGSIVLDLALQAQSLRKITSFSLEPKDLFEFSSLVVLEEQETILEFFEGKHPDVVSIGSGDLSYGTLNDRQEAFESAVLVTSELFALFNLNDQEHFSVFENNQEVIQISSMTKLFEILYKPDSIDSSRMKQLSFSLNKELYTSLFSLVDFSINPSSKISDYFFKNSVPLVQNELFPTEPLFFLAILLLLTFTCVYLVLLVISSRAKIAIEFEEGPLPKSNSLEASKEAQSNSVSIFNTPRIIVAAETMGKMEKKSAHEHKTFKKKREKSTQNLKTSSANSKSVLSLKVGSGFPAN